MIGELTPGPSNSIADVEGIRVGHVTIWRDEPEPPEGRGVARSGVTAIVPPSLPLRAGVAVLNGLGELTGSHEICEWGFIGTPVYLTATMAVGRVCDGAVAVAVRDDPRIGVEEVLIPVVGECDDSYLSEARVVQVEAADAARAVDGASGWPFDEGAVGAGTGMSCLGWKGGIGSASRTADGHTVGVLVLANFGGERDLIVAGVPVGRHLPPGGGRASGRRSGCGWSRSGTARCVPRTAPRTRPGPARPPAASPGARPRRRAGNRASGSSAPAVRVGAAR